jgi:hypothetical protein
MADQEHLVAVPLQVAPSDRADTESRRTVELEGDRRVYLPAGPRFDGYASILEELAQRRLPAYLEIEPDGRSVARLLLPHVQPVQRLFKLDQGVLGVELEVSHARHLLRSTTPGAERMEALLRESADRGTTLVITEDDEHSIIDVRRPEAGWERSTPGPPGPPSGALRWKPFRVVWETLKAILALVRPVSYTKATQVFDALNTLSCNPVSVPPPCIPFMYPDDGCWGRAHEMGRLMRGMGTFPRKVWIEGWLIVETKNHPSCEVHWIWHVAPILRVRTWIFFSSTMVIDPALFGKPVLESVWKAVQGDPHASLTHTSADIFWLWTSGIDADNSQTEGVLSYYRTMLRTRSLNTGPPPYAHCP